MIFIVTGTQSLVELRDMFKSLGVETNDRELVQINDAIVGTPTYYHLFDKWSRDEINTRPYTGAEIEKFRKYFESSSNCAIFDFRLLLLWDEFRSLVDELNLRKLYYVIVNEDNYAEFISNYISFAQGEQIVKKIADRIEYVKSDINAKNRILELSEIVKGKVKQYVKSEMD